MLVLSGICSTFPLAYIVILRSGHNAPLCTARPPKLCLSTLRVPLEALQAAALEAVMPLFRGAVDAAEMVLLRMHSQAWDAPEPPDIARPSQYMVDLARHLAMFRHVPPHEHFPEDKGP